MQLYLIRHAESENNARPPQVRVEDPALTARGHLQAESLAKWSETLDVETLVCSPVRRALQTARYLVDAVPQNVHVWADVFEEGGIYRGYGPDATQGGSGLRKDEIIEYVTGEESACVLDDTIGPNGWWNQDRETAEETIVRAQRVSQRLVDTFGAAGAPVVVVTHADFKRKLMHQLIGDRVDVTSLGRMRNTGISKLSYDGQRWILDWFNSVSHLPAKLVTDVEW